MRKIGEPSRCSALPRLGQKHRFVHLCQQLQRWQAQANLARSLEEARDTVSHPGNRVRKIHHLEPPSNPPQLSPCRVFCHRSDTAKLKGLSVVLEARHASTCCIFRNSLGRPVTKVHVTMGVRSVVSSVCPQHHASPEKRPQHQSYCGGSTWEHSEQIGPV